MKTRAFIYVIITGILWGTSGIFVHLLAPFGFSSLQMTAMRSTVSFLLVSLYALFRDIQAFRVTKKSLVLYIIGGIALFSTAAFYFISMQASSISTAVVLMYLAPAIVMVFSVTFLGEKLTLPKGIALCLMLAGCALVAGVLGGMSFQAWGVVAGVLSGVSYSVYQIMTKVLMRYNHNAFSATLYYFLVATILSLCLANPVEMVRITETNPAKILPLMLLIGICTFVLPYILYASALKRLPVGVASTLLIVEPMSATVFGVLLFHEEMNIPKAAGIIMILCAICLLSVNTKQE